MMRSTPGVWSSRPNSTPQSTTIHLRSSRRAEAIGVEVHADLARPAERQEDQFVLRECAIHACSPCAGVAGVDQHQAADGEIGIEMVDGRDCRVGTDGEAAGATTVIGLPYSSLMRVDQALDQADIAPVDAGLHGGHGVACRSRSGCGGWRRAAAWRRPGAAPRRKDWRRARSRRLQSRRSRDTMSKLVAVPKSTTISGALVALMRGDGVDQPVGAHRLGTVDIDLDAQVERRDRRPPAARVLRYLRQRWRRSNSAAGTTRGDDRGVEIGEGQAFQRQKLAQPARHIRRRCAWSRSPRAIGRASSRRHRRRRRCWCCRRRWRAAWSPKNTSPAAMARTRPPFVAAAARRWRRCLRTRPRVSSSRSRARMRRAQTRRPRQPGVAHGGKPFAAPDIIPMRRSGRRGRSAPRPRDGRRSAQRRQRGGGKFGAFGMRRQIDADADGEPAPSPSGPPSSRMPASLLPSASTSLGHFTVIAASARNAPPSRPPRARRRRTVAPHSASAASGRSSRVAARLPVARLPGPAAPAAARGLARGADPERPRSPASARRRASSLVESSSSKS